MSLLATFLEDDTGRRYRAVAVPGSDVAQLRAARTAMESLGSEAERQETEIR